VLVISARWGLLLHHASHPLPEQRTPSICQCLDAALVSTISPAKCSRRCHQCCLVSRGGCFVSLFSRTPPSETFLLRSPLAAV
jgi:hypothetical protein